MSMQKKSLQIVATSNFRESSAESSAGGQFGQVCLAVWPSLAFPCSLAKFGLSIASIELIEREKLEVDEVDEVCVFSLAV